MENNSDMQNTPDMSEKELMLGTDKMVSRLEYDFEIMTNKIVNNSFKRYIMMLNTYYERINTLALNSDGISQWLSDTGETLRRISEISEKINETADKITDIYKQNDLLIRIMLDYLKKSGENAEAYVNEREQLQNSERQRDEEKIAKTDEEKPEDEMLLNNDNEMVKSFVKEFNTLFYQNVRGLLERGWFTASVKMWTGVYLVENDSSDFRYLAYIMGEYMIIFPTYSIVKQENIKYFGELFDIKFYSNNPQKAKIYALKACVMKKKGNGYRLIEKGFIKII